MKIRLLTYLCVTALSYGAFAQQQTVYQSTSQTVSTYVRDIPALSTMDNIISAQGFDHVAPPKRRGTNTFVEGKGLPNGNDPLIAKQRDAQRISAGGSQNILAAPSVSFDAHIGTVLNDPTGAIGPNHYVYAFNSGFGILDRSGNVLVPEASLSTLFPGETLGDPVVVYDNFADRFIVMEFSNTPNGILIAVCQGPDPVNDGWHTYRFNTSSFPDYEKLSIWSDGYYITANKDQNSITTSEVVFALERDQMLTGGTAQMIGFPLPSASNNGFYSPGGFNATGTSLPPVGVGHPLVYMQDDSWSGVSQDHLKVWTTDVDWNTATNSTISTPQILNTAAFDGVFNNGSFNNLDEPGNGTDLDAIQATMMFMTNYRRFGTHNSVVMNYVVDVNGNDQVAGIRWYELRQTNDGDPWSIYQEGTYVQPDGHSAYCGSIAMDAQGNIGLAYTVVSSTVFTSLRYTGRLAGDVLGSMTLGEEPIVDGNSTENRGDGRYGDYAQMSIDPLDDMTFWHIGEYFSGSGIRRSHVAAFALGSIIPDNEAPTIPNGLISSNIGSASFDINWNASTDNIAVSGYRIYVDGVNVSSTAATSTSITGLTPNTSYTVAVSAYDAAGNESAQSISINETTTDASLTCITTVSSYPYSEGFEANDGWAQISGDDGDWVRDSGGTPSSGTGPGSAVEGSFYMFLEASTNSSAGQIGPNATAILESGCFDLSTETSATFSFQYHMYGTSVGSLVIQSSVDDLNWTDLWSLSGDQGNVWNAVDVSLNAYTGGNVKLRIVGTTGTSWSSDIAIDELSVTTGVGGDTEAPTAPTALASSSITQTSFDVSWTASTDNVGVIGYNVYLNGALNGTTATTSYAFSGLTASTLYAVAVEAFDAVALTSAQSSINVTTSDVVGGCAGGITSYPYSEGFETNDGWTQISGDDGNWLRDSGGTPSSGTGPSSAVEGSFYMFLEASTNSSVGQIGSNATATLESNCFDLSGESTATFSFQYHMYGTSVGSLVIQASVDDINWGDLWSLSGDQGDAWNAVNVSLDAYTGGSVKLRIVGTTGTSWSSDIAVDDLSVTTEILSCTDVTLNLVVDDWPEEISWAITDGGGATVASAAYTTSTPDGATIIESACLNDGCYTFTIFDAASDGICCAYGNGSYTLQNAGGTVLASGGSYTALEATNFCVTGTASASRAVSTVQTYKLNGDEIDDFEIFPNPATNLLKFTMSDRTVDRIQIFSMYGRLVGDIPVQDTKEIDISDLSSGTYFVRFTTEGKGITRKFIKE